MARIARMVIRDEAANYHLISRSTLEGFVIGDGEKEFLLNHLRRLGAFYFTEILGFCFMDNHFHLFVRMHPGWEYSKEEIFQRYEAHYGRKKAKLLGEEEIEVLRVRLGSLSSFMKDFKQGFSQYYNKLHDKQGCFWGDRFKSIIVEDGEALLNCLAYIDLNPVRAGLVKRPEEYRWSSIGQHVQGGNRGGFLSTDFGFSEWGGSAKDRLRLYREFLYEKGGLPSEKGASIDVEILKKERERDFELGVVDRFLFRTRHFTEGAVLGSREFVSGTYARFRDRFPARREKEPCRIEGIEGLYTLTRLPKPR